MSDNPLIAGISKETGLTDKQLKPGNPLISGIQRESGTYLGKPNGRKYGLDGLDISAGTISLTNTYTDPLESYTSYGVARNPFIDWNDTRAQNQSAIQKFAYGSAKAGITALGAVAENTVGVVGGLLNLAFGENHSYYDNPVGRSIDEVNEWAREAMPNYYTKKEEQMGVLEGLGTANFWADKFLNGFGYTLGSMATMWLGTGEGALLAKMGNVGRMSKIGKAADVAMDLGDDAAKLGSKQFQAYNAAKVANGGGTNIAGSIDDGLVQMARRSNIKSAAKHLSVGLHMSLAEASVEARETKNRFIEEQKAKWEEENPGQEMPADVEEGIVASAAAAGNLAFGINLPVLTLTNLFTFHNMIKTGKPSAEALSYDIKKVGNKWVEAIPEKGMARAFAKSSRIFGSPIKSSASEAFQEGTQFAASEGARDYYSDKFSDGVGDMVEAFSNALETTVGTKEGLESMLIGALIGGGTGTVSRLFGADKKFAKAKEANTKKALDILNSGSFANVLENMELSEGNRSLMRDIDEAIKGGNLIEAEKLRRRLISKTANHYRKSGALDYAMEQMDDLKQLSEEEFKKRWNYDANRTLKEQTGMEQSELIDDVKSKMQRSIKRQEQVESIIRAQQPSKAIFSRILDSFETKEIKDSKALESSLRNMYADQLLYRLENVDAVDDLIKDQYQKLIEIAPNLSQLSEEDFDYMVKTGKIEIDKEGDIKIIPQVSAQKTDKLTDKLNEIFKAKRALNPEDAKEFEKVVKDLNDLIIDRQVAVQSYNGIRNSPEDLALLVEAEIEKRKMNDSSKKNQQAKAAIENAQSTEELDMALPKGISEEDLALATAKRAQLAEQEDAIARNYETLTDEEFNAIDEDNLSPAEEVAYRRIKRARDQRDASKKYNIRLSEDSPLGEVSSDLEYDEVINRVFGETLISPDGSEFIIKGRSYYNLEDNPVDAIIKDTEGNTTGIRLTDVSTGNTVSWIFENVSESSNPDVVAMDNAIIDSLEYVILLQASAVRADQSIPLSQAKEELEPRIEAANQDLIVREKFEENTESTETEADLAKNNMSKTAALTDEQLRAQVETLKADLENINEILHLQKLIAEESGFTMKEFYEDAEVKTMVDNKRSTVKLLLDKIKILHSRKAARKKELVPNTEVNTEDAVAQELTDNEESILLAGLNEEIQNLEKDKAGLTASLQTYEDVLAGKYDAAPDPDAAKQARRSTVRQNIKELKKKIGVIDSKLTKRKNKITEVNEKRQLAELRKNRDAAERSGETAQGQESQGTDLNPGTPVEAEGMAPISGDALDFITQQIEMAAEVAREQEIKNEQANTPINEVGQQLQTNITTTVTTTDPVVRNVGESDVRLAKGEVLTKDNKVVVGEDLTATPNDFMQTIGGVPIVVDPGILGNPDFANSGTIITFEVREDTDWWAGEASNIPQENHWETVPIYATAIDPATGEKVYIQLLQSAKASLSPGEQGLDRQDIYNLYKQGLTPIATVVNKRFNSTNFANARTNTGDTVFFPASNMGQNPTIMYVGAKKGVGKVLRMANPGDNTIPGIEDVNFDLEKLTPGQVVFPVKDPNGNPTFVVGSTRNVTPEVVTVVTEAIKNAEAPSADLLDALVGVNMFVSQQESGQYDMPTDVSDDIVELRQIESDNFMFVETLLNGTQLLTFYSPSANSLVRTSMEELQAGLKGAKPRFSFVELGVNEKGYPAVLPVANETANREDISTKLAEDFKQSMLSRKMQVSKDLLAANQPFTSPINNQTYDSYFDFLTAENGLSTTREEGVGSNSILAVDVIANNYGSVFYDVGLKMSNLSTVEKPTQLEEDLQVKQIAATVAPTQAPTVPATDARTDIEKTEYGTISGSRPLSEIVGEDGKYYDLGNNIFAVVFDNGKIAAIVDKNYEVNGKYITEKAFGKDGKFKSPNEKNVEITAKANNQDVAVRIQRLNQATEKLNELAALGQPVAEDTVVEITGPQSTADILDVLNITPAAPALDDPFLSRPLATAEEIQGFNEELAATDALNNQELAQAIQEYCQSQNQANN